MERLEGGRLGGAIGSRDDGVLSSTARMELVEGESFDELCRQHRSHLERAALSLAGNHDDAMDLVQETMIRAYRYFHNYQPGSNFRAWVLRILHNTHISQYRQRRKSLNDLAWDDVAEHGEDKIEAAISDATPDHILLSDLPDAEVQAALDSLPPNFRKVVELADLRELSYAEVGELLDLPIGTVRSRLFRARERLRAQLSEYAVRNGYVSRDEVDARNAA